jgi:hypothetical protein
MMDYPADATYNGTRCCGATSVHWAGCRERLDITNPASYRQIAPDETCDQCGAELNGEAYDFPDGEGGTLTLCGQCWGGVK